MNFENIHRNDNFRWNRHKETNAEADLEDLDISWIDSHRYANRNNKYSKICAKSWTYHKIVRNRPCDRIKRYVLFSGIDYQYTNVGCVDGLSQWSPRWEYRKISVSNGFVRKFEASIFPESRKSTILNLEYLADTSITPIFLRELISNFYLMGSMLILLMFKTLDRIGMFSVDIFLKKTLFMEKRCPAYAIIQYILRIAPF